MADMEELVRMRRMVTDKKSELTTQYEAKKRELDRIQEDLDEQIMAALNVAGIKSARTAAGTATISTQTNYHVKDWSVVEALAKEHDDFGFYQKRLSSTRFRQYLDEGNDMPEGIAPVNINKVSITKA
ncbi:MAG: hypothetical protein ACK5MY_02580 [Jhaorihella sp.]